MGTRDEMFRAKVLIFMVPLLLPIGQPPAQAVDRSVAARATDVASPPSAPVSPLGPATLAE
ncbi:MAG: hypothetical protein AAF710_07435 [Planctomycetota bacterium]